MGPTTLAITHKVVSSCSALSTTAILGQAWRKDGWRGWYPGGTALALRQASNWALRQGFTEAARVRMVAARHPGEGTSAKLSRSEELVCGIIGGTLSTLNQPFEVARIEAQSRSAAGEPALSMASVVRIIVKQSGFAGLYAGILPRIGLAVWQTTFMVVAPKLIRAFAEEMDEELSSAPDAVALEEGLESE